MIAKALSTKTTCMPFMHKWTRWGMCIKDYSGNWIQLKECTQCGRVKARKSIRIMHTHITGCNTVDQVLKQDRENRT